MLWVGYRTCRAAELPASGDWLSPGERETLARLTIIKRKTDFELGRFVAKQALVRAWARTGRAPLNPTFSVIAAADGAPEASFENGQPAPFAISISHSHARAVCAVALEDQRGNVRLGCDLELVEPRSEELVRQFFTEVEQQRVLALHADDAPLVATLIWSAKESALKALRSGLRADTRSVEVDWHERRSPGEWQPLSVTTDDGSVLTGYWRTLSFPEPADAPRLWILTTLSEPEHGPPELLSDQPIMTASS